MRKLVKKLRRKISFTFGRFWKIRCLFVPSSEKKRAYDYLDEHQNELVFVMGTGRSGTQLISNLLSCSGDTAVFHEPNFNEDVGCMDLFRSKEEIVRQYWGCFRSVEVYKRWVNSMPVRLYGEVNGTIRYQAAAIRSMFPLSKMFLMARDGRGVVRSVMGWEQFYSDKSKGAYALSPLPNDPYYQQWHSMSRFEKVCWSWMDSNEYLMKHIPSEYWIRLEGITSDYDYFSKHFCDKLDIHITEEKWNVFVNKKSGNSTKIYLFPEWNEWSERHKDDFERICGGTMKKLGYIF